MNEPQMAYQIKIITDITCSPGGGIDIHSLMVELPFGTVVKATEPVKVDCWPKLPTHVMTNQIQRLLAVAAVPLDSFTTPDIDTPAGVTIGNVEAEMNENVLDVIWDPRDTVKAGGEGVPVVGAVNRLICADGAPPIAHADPMGEITYICRDGSTPFTATQSFFDTSGSNLGLPHLTDGSEEVTVKEPMVTVVAKEYWNNIPLLSIGCCNGGDPTGPTTDPTGTTSSTSTPTVSTSTGTPTASTTAATTETPTGPTAEA